MTVPQMFSPEFLNTDMGNARRMHALYGDSVHYVKHWASWLAWNGQHWIKDTTGAIDRMAHKTADQMWLQAAYIEDTDRATQARKWAHATQMRAKLSAMVAVFQELPGIMIDHDVFDRDPWLLNVANGTLNLQTGKLQPHDKSDHITKMIDVSYDANAQCPRWLAFLDRIFSGDKELIEYIQRAVGYSLTGNVSEQCLHFAYGTGKNGKSVFFEVLQKLLGDYAQKAPTSMLMHRNSDAIPIDVAQLQGIRFVVASEIEKGARLAEAKIKDLTGDDTLTARFMRANLFQFTPTHTLWIYGNHKPSIRGIDEGIWRRMRLIPFNVSIPEAERDTRLKEKLITDELPGILAWAVTGCLNWQANSLSNQPASILRATNDYRGEMDMLSTFVSEECNVTQSIADALKVDIAATQVQTDIRDTLSNLYGRFSHWCDNETHEYRIKRKEFQDRLETLGVLWKPGTANKLYGYGICLKVHTYTIKPSTNGTSSEPMPNGAAVTARN